jgi:hypothetical protein
VAREQRTTLNALFREWLEQISQREAQDHRSTLEALQERLGYAKAGGKFTRDQMNERSHGN